MERKGMGPFLVDRYNQFGPVFSWQLGNHKVVAVLAHDTIKTLLKVGDGKAVLAWNPEAMYAMLGEGARRSLEDPAFRKSSRKHMAPGFSREALRGYISKLVDICSSQLDSWCAAGGPVDLAAEGKDLSFEFSTQLLVDFRIPPERKAELKEKFNRLFRGMVAPPINLPGTRYSQGLAARGELLQDIRVLMSQRQAGPRKSVLDFMLEGKAERAQGRSLSDTELAESGIGLIIAGNDTSGLGVTALLAVLPLFPDVMDKLRQEQEQLIAEYGPELSVNLLDRMVYAEVVIKEVLRLAPPSGLVMRRTTVDMEICGKFVPAGTILHLSTFLGQVLTDPRLDISSLSPSDLTALYNNWALITPDTLSVDFQPERWLVPLQDNLGQDQAAQIDPSEVQMGLKSPDAGPDSSSNSSLISSSEGLQRPSGLLTFSAGPHACLGYSLFMAEAKVLLSVLARGYTAEPVDAGSLNFKTNFLTLLRQGTVKFAKQGQPLPIAAAERVSSSASNTAAQAAEEAAVAV